MNVIITGATGFIGSGLSRRLLALGHSVTAVTRDPQTAQVKLGKEINCVRWDPRPDREITLPLESADAIINLAGENISSYRWTKRQMELILNSRVEAGRAIASAIKMSRRKPSVVVQASAVGFYGNRGDETLVEASPPGEGFLPLVARQWEDSTRETEEFGIRRVVVRTGVVLSRYGGALPKILLPFRFYAGGTIGSGKQWLPWIHYDDEIESIVFLLENQKLSGIFNLTSPEPVNFKQLAAIIGRLTRRPSWLPVPSFALRGVLGKMADELLLTSQRVLPERLKESGYPFKFPNLSGALGEILKENK